MEEALFKAGILVEALPYIEQFRGKTVVIKYGGHAMLSDELQQAVMQDVLLLHYVGIRPVVVHGGGPEITRLLERLGIESSFVNGLRVTDAETMEVAQMVLAGKLNKEVVTHLNRLGGRAVGLSGHDGCLLRAVPQKAFTRGAGGEPVACDLGFVGEVEAVDPALLQTLLAQGYIPVMAPLAVGPDWHSYNVNADLAAAALAVALGAEKLVLLTDVEGVRRDPADPGSLISTLRAGEVPGLLEEGVLTGGMIPKVECCLRALQGGVRRAHILDGRLPHSILLEIFTDTGSGTMVIP